jgi:O-antigen ligase
VRRVEALRTRSAASLLALIALLFVWWAWKQGAYFGSVFYPGAMVVFLLVALLLVLVPVRFRLSLPAKVTLGALFFLSIFELASALWSPLPALAIRYAWHDFLYLAVFVLGLVVTRLLGRRSEWSLGPVAVAGIAVGIATVVVLASGTDVTHYLHEDGTLRFPIGYRNANAAFWMVCLWPALALACGDSDWRLRALFIAGATMLLQLDVVSQSRGSLPAAALAALLFIVFSRDRLRAAMMMALVAIPVLPALSTLLDVFQYGHYNTGVIPLLRDSARAIGLTTGLSLVLALLVLGVGEPRVSLPSTFRLWLARGLAAIALIAVLVGAGAFVARHGGPTGFIDQRIKEFDRVGYPNLDNQTVRYGANVGSNRHDFWRVSVDEGLEHPLVGGGGGAFQVDYMQHRRSDETPEDPHSVEALMFSELGFPGLIALLCFVVGAVICAVRTRLLGRAHAIVVAGAVAAAAQWFAGASWDWIWNYPAITAPAIFLLGAAVAPALGEAVGPLRRGLGALGATALFVLTVCAVPLFFSARYLARGYALAAADPGAAITSFGKAAELNPLEVESLTAKASMQGGEGETAAALATLGEARDRTPEYFLAQYLTARELAATHPIAARAVLRRARELNPLAAEVKELAHQLSKGKKNSR